MDLDRIHSIRDVFVDKYYVMDPGIETILYDGTSLQDGMIVLIDRTESREELREKMTPAQLDNARWNNRWAKIDRIEIRGENISFFATYEDHTVKKRVVNVHFPWLVRLDSIPVPNQKLHDDIFRTVYQGLQYQDSLATSDVAVPGDSIHNRAGKITDDILAMVEAA